MTKDKYENTKEKIRVMQAYVDGKDILLSYKCQEPDDDPDPNWDWVYGHYYIKEECE